MFDLTYDLGDHGWAKATIALGDRSEVIAVSYLTDPLKYLARAAVAALATESLPFSAPKEIIFGGEPEGLILRVEYPPKPELRNQEPSDPGRNILVSLLFSPDWMEGRNVVTELWAEESVGCTQFAIKVETVLLKTLEGKGLAGYLKSWSLAYFPVAEFANLRSLLNMPPLALNI